MKKICMSVILLSILNACSLSGDRDIALYEHHQATVTPLQVDYPLYRELFRSSFAEPLTDADVLALMVSLEIRYSSVNGEYWKTAEETWQDKSGDCEDFCTLYLGLLKQENLYDGQTMIVVNSGQGELFTYHTKIADRKRMIEYELTGGFLQISPLQNHRVLKEYSYGEVMYQAYEKKRLDWIF